MFFFSDFWRGKFYRIFVPDEVDIKDQGWDIRFKEIMYANFYAK